MGGLGNQLFQYAAGRALALRHNTGLTLDLEWFTRLKTHEHYQPYMLDAFHIWTVPGPGPVAPLVCDAHPRFTEYVLDAPDGSVLDGYWQSERYFEDFADRIRMDLRLRSPGKFPAELDQRTVAVHVRRGGDHYLGYLGNDYYQDALKLIDSRCLPIVFTDDREWCRDNLDLGRRFIIWDGSALDDLWLMSHCDHNIIANSTFSWWGAWLNDNPYKVVVAPTGYSPGEPEFFTPQGWHLIECPA